MKVYLVGGAVRDQLLGFPIKERDWVVVGATPEEMLKRGFKQVGRDFPVFLHPKTHEEYALARTERKVGKGYRGFVCYSDSSITLEDDLNRRDLTINAMAKDRRGNIIDPFSGRQDLKKRILHHVSPAFAEDPVRILRVARFAARFGNFRVHPQTNKLMQEMLAKGEVDTLVPERVWQELERALKEANPAKFFIALKNCRVLLKLFPEIARHLPAINKGLQRVINLSQESPVRFATIAFNLDKEGCNAFCKKYRLPNNYRELSLIVLRLRNELLPLAKNPEGLVNLLECSDGYRKPERLQQALSACLANNKKLTFMVNKIWLAYKITKKAQLTPQIIRREDKKDLRQILHTKRYQLLVNKAIP
jgi:tRNA nucleotidyltransferase (CCA-adding enzyme)